VHPPTFAARFRMAREILRGTSVAALARASGVPRGRIAELETGEMIPRAELGKLLKVLEIDPEWMGVPETE
jgi:transcriptional regulator with XRE-family HTH domain